MSSLLVALALVMSMSATASGRPRLRPGPGPDRIGVRPRPGPGHDTATATRRDTLAARRDSARHARYAAARARRAARIVPVTPALLATAFRDPAARTLLARARAARLAQDSTLDSYDATAYERLSTGMTIGPIGRERLLFRTEHATRIRWVRGQGAVVDVTGARVAAPILGKLDPGDRDLRPGAIETGPIPYYPGREALWLGSGIAHADVSGSWIIHPLAQGAEAYYTYAAGDSLSFQLGAGRRIVVRELRVQPRRAAWNTVVGSLWFDVATGQLVRGIFRLAVPMDMMAVARQDGDHPERDIPVWLRPAILPMRASVRVITVDYGLYEGRYWLPRMQLAEGHARVGAMRVPFSLRQRFDYASVNGRLSLPPVQVAASDTATGASAHAARRTAREAACRDTAATRMVRRVRYDSLHILVRIPCDTAALARSPTLPKSIYDTPDSLLADPALRALEDEAIGLGRQAAFAPARPELHGGLPYARYDRIEGLSLGAAVTQLLGAGYEARALARIGLADWSPEGELSLARSNGTETYTASAYRRLVSADDWRRNPFTLGASLSTLLFGHDDGIYYHTAGVELAHQQTVGPRWFDTWRLYAEQEFDARPHTDFSLAGSLRARSRFPDNIDATNGSVVGLVVERRGTRGEDPAGTRLFSQLQLDAAAGAFDYARGMLDVTVSRPIAGPVAAALTLGGGTSAGAVPTQRLWYLGGTPTVRGQDVGVRVGDAFWLSRLELGLGNVAARPIVFGDLGWAGDRRHWRDAVVPVSGAGVGVSFLDGLVRVDVAKGIRPAGGVRGSLYLDSRF